MSKTCAAANAINSYWIGLLNARTEWRRVGLWIVGIAVDRRWASARVSNMVSPTMTAAS